MGLSPCARPQPVLCRHSLNAVCFPHTLHVCSPSPCRRPWPWVSWGDPAEEPGRRYSPLLRLGRAELEWAVLAPGSVRSAWLSPPRSLSRHHAAVSGLPTAVVTLFLLVADLGTPGDSPSQQRQSSRVTLTSQRADRLRTEAGPGRSTRHQLFGSRGCGPSSQGAGHWELRNICLRPTLPGAPCIRPPLVQAGRAAQSERWRPLQTGVGVE